MDSSSTQRVSKKQCNGVRVVKPPDTSNHLKTRDKTDDKQVRGHMVERPRTTAVLPGSRVKTRQDAARRHAVSGTKRKSDDDVTPRKGTRPDLKTQDKTDGKQVRGENTVHPNVFARLSQPKGQVTARRVSQDRDASFKVPVPTDVFARRSKPKGQVTANRVPPSVSGTKRKSDDDDDATPRKRTRTDLKTQDKTDDKQVRGATAKKTVPTAVVLASRMTTRQDTARRRADATSSSSRTKTDTDDKQVRGATAKKTVPTAVVPASRMTTRQDTARRRADATSSSSSNRTKAYTDDKQVRGPTRKTAPATVVVPGLYMTTRQDTARRSADTGTKRKSDDEGDRSRKRTRYDLKTQDKTDDKQVRGPTVKKTVTTKPPVQTRQDAAKSPADTGNNVQLETSSRKRKAEDDGGTSKKRSRSDIETEDVTDDKQERGATVEKPTTTAGVSGLPPKTPRPGVKPSAVTLRHVRLSDISTDEDEDEDEDDLFRENQRFDIKFQGNPGIRAPTTTAGVSGLPPKTPQPGVKPSAVTLRLSDISTDEDEDEDENVDDLFREILKCDIKFQGNPGIRAPTALPGSPEMSDSSSSSTTETSPEDERLVYKRRCDMKPQAAPETDHSNGPSSPPDGNTSSEDELIYRLASTGNRSKADFRAKYRQHALIGEGGFGSVYEGYCKTNCLWVAIKRIRPDAVRHQTVTCNGNTYNIVLEVAFLMKTGGLPGSPKRSDIVSLIEWYYFPDEVILILERPTLAKDLRSYCYSKGGFLEEHHAKVIMKKLVDACIYMHSEGVFHRDIKMANILIWALDPLNPEIWIIDFGCGAFCQKTAYSTFCGTKFYAPPEWLKHHWYHSRPTTVWQLGRVYHKLLSGCSTRVDSLHETIRNDSFLSEDVKNLLCRCLAIEPRLRMTLEELQQRLRLP